MDVRGDVIDGRYLVRELLGSGGMAEVFRATDTATDRGVAIKVLRNIEPGSVRRFGSEVDVLARLDHPGLVKLRGSGTHEGVPYLVLDLAEGPSLAGELAGGAIGTDRALAVGEQVAEALAHAHRLGIVHRDVKPANVLFDELGRARLADFGIARLAGTPSLTGTGQLIGSAPYIAPELVAGQQAGPAADVYSLGLVMIECLTGRPCYSGGQVEAVVSRLHRPPGIPPHLPGWLRAVLAGMTAADPARRPAAGAVADALCRREAGPVLAATAPIDRAPLTPLAEGGTTRAQGEADPRAQGEADPAATVRDVTVDSTLTTGYVSPADRAAPVSPGATPRSDGPRNFARHVRTVLAAAVLCIAILSLLAWTVGRADPPASRPRGEAVTTSSTSGSPTTVDLVPAPKASSDAARPAAGHDSDGKGKAKGKGDRRH